MRFRYLVGPAALALLAFTAHAQQPVLPGAPQPGQPAPAPALPPPPPPTSPMRTAALPNAEIVGFPGEVIGQTYSVETVGGILFSGTLKESTTLTLTFETKELGIVTLQRTSLRQLTVQTAEQARRGFDYVGNGTRMFFAPTARGLHQGEGTVEAIDIFLLGIDYGFTDNFSAGLYLPIIPAVGIPFVAVTPKLSAPVSKNFSLGAGVLYAFTTDAISTSGRSGGGSVGLGYGVATFGTADNNVSFGLGYGFASDRYSSTGTPVGVVGANVRLSRLFSLVNETYLADYGEGAVAGLAGQRLALPRLSGSLGVLYYTGRYGGVYPSYLSVAYRFGKVKLK